MFSYSRGHQPLWNCVLLPAYRLMRRATSLIHTSEIKILLNLSLIILVLIHVNVKTMIMLLLFLEQAPWATYMVFAGGLVPTVITLVTPVL